MYTNSSFFLCAIYYLLLAPPVDASFRTSCTEQQRRSPGIRCEGNGTFSLLQCMGRRCFCVAPETGERINTETFPKGQENTMPCSTGAYEMHTAFRYTVESPNKGHFGTNINSSGLSTV